MNQNNTKIKNMAELGLIQEDAQEETRA